MPMAHPMISSKKWRCRKDSGVPLKVGRVVGPSGSCSVVAGRTYTEADIHQTGNYDIGRAEWDHSLNARAI